MGLTVKVLFPSGEVKDVPAHVQMELFPQKRRGGGQTVIPDCTPDWDFRKLAGHKVKWAAIHAKQKGQFNEYE